ncbi:hypothetical protein QR46_2143 [Giardia duodenalis assemblage B]|uniref:Uncharacterized protein n=2 Tax=Giardia intestinalis TaxID=5741 RepID=A0A132NUW2_GIAIN|nr:Hypothetical protein GL50581_2976 [Giardia intestinalis ATCC 50581]KWX13861.1 hypothetical protein QR46_2143 [Giardia intestinalis assemblage B]
MNTQLRLTGQQNECSVLSFFLSRSAVHIVAAVGNELYYGEYMRLSDLLLWA